MGRDIWLSLETPEIRPYSVTAPAMGMTVKQAEPQSHVSKTPNQRTPSSALTSFCSAFFLISCSEAEKPKLLGMGQRTGWKAKKKVGVRLLQPTPPTPPS